MATLRHVINEDIDRMLLMRVSPPSHKRFLFHPDKGDSNHITIGSYVETSLCFAPRDIPKYLMGSLAYLIPKILAKILVSLPSPRFTNSDLASLILSSKLSESSKEHT